MRRFSRSSGSTLARSKSFVTAASCRRRRSVRRSGVSEMMYVHSLGRAARYYPERPAILGSEGERSTFRELHDRVAAVAAALSRHGFRAGDRLALPLPNEPDYLELIYACSCLGVISLPVNAPSPAAQL